LRTLGGIGLGVRARGGLDQLARRLGGLNRANGHHRNSKHSDAHPQNSKHVPVLPTGVKLTLWCAAPSNQHDGNNRLSPQFFVSVEIGVFAGAASSV
jgi:hypothetical protein